MIFSIWPTICLIYMYIKILCTLLHKTIEILHDDIIFNAPYYIKFLVVRKFRGMFTIQLQWTCRVMSFDSTFMYYILSVYYNTIQVLMSYIKTIGLENVWLKDLISRLILSLTIYCDMNIFFIRSTNNTVEMSWSYSQ